MSITETMDFDDLPKNMRELLEELRESINRRIDVDPTFTSVDALNALGNAFVQFACQLDITSGEAVSAIITMVAAHMKDHEATLYGFVPGPAPEDAS